MRKSLILLCEAHFAILYIVQFNLVSKTLVQKGSFCMEVLSQLGMVLYLPTVSCELYYLEVFFLDSLI